MTTPPRKSASAKRPSGKSRAAGKSAAAAKTVSPDEAKAASADTTDTAAASSDKPSPKPDTGTESAAAFTPPPPVRTTGAARVLAWLTLVIGLLVGTAAVTWPWWSDRFAGMLPFLAPADGADPAIGQLAGRVMDLERRTREKSETLQQLEQERARFQGELKTLMARLAEVEQAVADARHLARAAEAPAGTTAAAESLKMLSDRLAELEQGEAQVGALAQRLEQIEKSRADTGQGAAPAAVTGPDPATMATLDAMAQRLKRLEQETDGKEAVANAAAARAIVLAVAQLRDAVREGAPFDADLEALKALAAGRPAIAQSIDALAPHSGTGVPTLAVLRTKFATLAGPIVAAAGTADGDGWIAEAAARLASLVTVRRIGAAAPSGSVDALVARVDVLLSAGDLNAAAEALKLLKGKPAEVVEPWLRAAEARLAAEKAVANLHVHALSLLAPAKAGG